MSRSTPRPPFQIMQASISCACSPAGLHDTLPCCQHTTLQQLMLGTLSAFMAMHRPGLAVVRYLSSLFVLCRSQGLRSLLIKLL